MLFEHDWQRYTNRSQLRKHTEQLASLCSSHAPHVQVKLALPTSALRRTGTCELKQNPLPATHDRGCHPAQGLLEPEPCRESLVLVPRTWDTSVERPMDYFEAWAAPEDSTPAKPLRMTRRQVTTCFARAFATSRSPFTRETLHNQRDLRASLKPDPIIFVLTMTLVRLWRVANQPLFSLSPLS